MVELKVKVGDVFERWRVTSYASPNRQPSQEGARRRVNVRCVCGAVSTVYIRALLGKETRGCKNVKCAIRYQVVEELRRHLLKMYANTEDLDQSVVEMTK